jgi:hypothetical protein
MMRGLRAPHSVFRGSREPTDRGGKPELPRLVGKLIADLGGYHGLLIIQMPIHKNRHAFGGVPNVHYHDKM